MKGILLGGCSYTWGHGLWYYSELNEKPNNVNELKDCHKKFKDSLKYGRLIANHFETFEIDKEHTGGSDDISFDFFDVIFGLKNNNYLSSQKYNYNDISYIIFQTSQLLRNKFYFNYEGVEQYAILWESNDGYNVENFRKWLLYNNLTFNQGLDLHIKRQINRIKSRFEFYESMGIKTKIFCWEDDFLPYFINDTWFTNRFVPLFYDGKQYNSIKELTKDHKYLIIMDDYESFENPPYDGHPSKKCHRIIADSIIKNIEQTEKI